MTPLQSVAALLCFAALGGYINARWLKLPSAIGTTVTAAGFALLLLFSGHMGWIDPEHGKQILRTFDLQNVFLHGVLSLMLFAGALFVDAPALRRWAAPVFSLATLGVILSTLSTALLFWGAAGLLGFKLPFLWALAFGALIAPTDPIAALAVVRSLGAPKPMEVKLVGESLFNDGAGVMVFLLVLGWLLPHHAGNGSWLHWALLSIWEPLGGFLVGGGLAWLCVRALKQVDQHHLEVLLTLALATGSYALAEALYASAPLAAVVAGLVIGTKGRQHGMSAHTVEHVDQFWATLDELLNSALFALIGLELLGMNLGWTELLLGSLAWACVLAARSVGVWLPLLPFRSQIARGTMPVLIWGGLRGGISLALALSLPSSAYTPTLIAVTFIVVMLSGVGQGLTLGPLVRRMAPMGNRNQF